MSTLGEQHIAVDVLLQDWLGEIDPMTRDAVDAHLMPCDACGELLDELLALATGVRGAVRAGAVALVAGPGFLQRLAARAARSASIGRRRTAASIARSPPEDEFLVSRLQVPLQDVQRLDMAMELSVEPGVWHRVEDIPFDAQAGEVLFLPSVARVRQLPAHTMHLTLLAREDGGSREVARYEFRHTPWPEPGDG